MADRILALAGKGKGPVIYTGNLGNTKAKICGMKDGNLMIAANFSGDFENHPSQVLHIEKDGRYDAGAFPYMQAEYNGESFMICTLHAG